MSQRRHADPDGPDDLQVNHLRGQLERPCEVDDEYLKQNQECSALKQVARQLFVRRGVALGVKISGKAGQENEYGRAQVGREARQKQPRIGRAHIHWVGHLTVQEEIFTHMVGEHDEHRESAKCVDGVYAPG